MCWTMFLSNYTYIRLLLDTAVGVGHHGDEKVDKHDDRHHQVRGEHQPNSSLTIT
jgi:hypothetical protein